MLQRLRSRLHGEGGFTLIELLVVILIIGILAAIAIPSFLNQKGKGQDASTKSAARTAQTAIETYSTDNNGSYAATSANLKTIEPQLPTADANFTVTASDGTGTAGGSDNYKINVVANGRTYSITKLAAGTVSRTCTPVSSGGCPASGTW